MALVSTGGMEPLYSGVQITQCVALASFCCSGITAEGVPAAKARGVNSGRSSSVRSSTSALRSLARA